MIVPVILGVDFLFYVSILVIPTHEDVSIVLIIGNHLIQSAVRALKHRKLGIAARQAHRGHQKNGHQGHAPGKHTRHCAFRVARISQHVGFPSCGGHGPTCLVKCRVRHVFDGMAGPSSR